MFGCEILDGYFHLRESGINENYFVIGLGAVDRHPSNRRVRLRALRTCTASGLNIPPIASVKDGEILCFNFRLSHDASERDWTLADLKKMDMSKLDAAVGPILSRVCTRGRFCASMC